MERNKLSVKNKLLENGKNNPATALNILYIKEKEICPGYISKNHVVKNVILLMISNEEKESWRYLAVKKLSAFLHGMISKHN